MTIPQNLILTEELAFSPRYYFQNIFSELRGVKDPALDERALLVLLLLVERARGEESDWSIYIRNLPETYGLSLPENNEISIMSLKENFI